MSMSFVPTTHKRQRLSTMPRRVLPRLPAKIIVPILQDRLNTRLEGLLSSPSYENYIQYNISLLTIARVCRACLRLALETVSSHINDIRADLDGIPQRLNKLYKQRSRWRKRSTYFAQQLRDIERDIQADCEKRQRRNEVLPWVEKAQSGLLRAKDRIESGSYDVPKIIEWRNWNRA